MRVLVVEDDDGFMLAFRWRMKRAAPDAEIVQCPSPVDAIHRLVDGEAFDFVVTDLMFRGYSSGEDVIAAANSRHIPAILCSDLLELFGPQGMVLKVHFLENPWAYMVKRIAEAARACVPPREVFPCG